MLPGDRRKFVALGNGDFDHPVEVPRTPQRRFDMGGMMGRGHQQHRSARGAQSVDLE
jgi:hypothetical protein